MVTTGGGVEVPHNPAWLSLVGEAVTLPEGVTNPVVESEFARRARGAYEQMSTKEVVPS